MTVLLADDQGVLRRRAAPARVVRRLLGSSADIDVVGVDPRPRLLFR